MYILNIMNIMSVVEYDFEFEEIVVQQETSSVIIARNNHSCSTLPSLVKTIMKV